MFKSFRTLAVGGVLGLAVALGAVAPAQAFARVAVANDAKYAVGDRWQETVPGGKTVTMEKVAQGVSRSVGATTLGIGQCTGYPYLCAWSGMSFTGTFWRYNMNDVYVHTADGVAHCWNLAADANNNQKSWYNASDRRATISDWINCNEGGGSFDLGDAYDHDTNYGGSCNGAQAVDQFADWCTVHRATSILAKA